MSEKSEKSGRTVTEWSTILMALGGIVAGGGAIGLQTTAPEPMISKADVAVEVAAAVANKADASALASALVGLEKDLDTKVDQKDLDRVVVSVDKLIDKVLDLTVEVRSGRSHE